MFEERLVECRGGLMKSVFFIPVFNQIEEFPKVLEELKSTDLPCDTILLVNNGSSDGSERFVHESGYDYIDVEKNLGIGYSFMLAIDWALERDYDVFGVLASNGKMLPEEMNRVLDPIINDEADYTTGSRFLDGGEFPNLPLFRRIAIPMVNIFVCLFTGKMLTDCTCGYRAYKLDIMRRAEFDWHPEWMHTYGFEYYLYGKALIEKTVRCIEVPITMRYPPKGKRYSKMTPFKSWYHMVKPFVLARLNRKGFRPPP